MAAVGDDDCSQYLGGVKRTGGVKRGVGDGERLRREQGGAVPFPENVAMAMEMMVPTFGSTQYNLHTEKGRSYEG